MNKMTRDGIASVDWEKHARELDAHGCAILDHLIDQAIRDKGITQVLEIACGMSPRGIRLRQKHSLLHMVEADLPDMAARKALRLMATGRLGDHHQVTPIDILADHGEYQLEKVIDRVFENNETVIIVTEGLTSYFSLETITLFWRRLAAAMAKRPGSVYLSESYYQPSQPVLNTTLKLLGGVLGADLAHLEVAPGRRRRHHAALAFS